MALNNIWKEPRRELTEIGIGAGIILSVVALAAGIPTGIYFFFHWLFPGVDPFALIMIGLAITLVLIMLIGLGHEIGEDVCDDLAKKGRDPRPKQRYK